MSKTPSFADRLRTFLAELRRRKVYRVAIVYVIVAAGAIELSSALVPASRLPDWSDELLLSLAVLGLPLALVFAWAYEITASGVVRTSASESDESGRPSSVGSAPNESERGAATDAPDERTVAVLPFQNLGGSAEADPFTAGLHVDLLTELSRISALTVISRKSVASLGEEVGSIRKIGQALGAGTVIEGGVQQVGQRVRLNVQLVDARTEVQRWAERYDRDFTAEGLFELQSELVREVVMALRSQLTSREEAHLAEMPTADLDAYRAYALARDLFVARTEDRIRQAIEGFEEAVALDPEYALAWAGLGMARATLVDYGHEDPDVGLPPAEEAARRALELAPDLAEAHSALGLVLGTAARRDGVEALACQERAIELRPSYAGAHQWVAWVSLLIGRPERALTAAARATRLDPLDPEAGGNLAIARLANGDAAGALSESQRILERHPRFAYGGWAQALAMWTLDDAAGALAALEEPSEDWARPWEGLARALVLFRNDDLDGARNEQADLRAAGHAFHDGLIHAAFGSVERAFEAFDQCTEAGDLWWTETLYLRYPPPWPLGARRDDARYVELVAELDRRWGLA